MKTPRLGLLHVITRNFRSDIELFLDGDWYEIDRVYGAGKGILARFRMRKYQKAIDAIIEEATK